MLFYVVLLCVVVVVIVVVVLLLSLLCVKKGVPYTGLVGLIYCTRVFKV